MKYNSSVFCSDYFWDLNLTWYTEKPRFSQCFKNTIVVVPSGVFVLTCIPWIFWILSVKKRLKIKTNPPISWIYLTKMVLTLFLIIFTGMKIYMEIYQSSILTMSDCFNFVLTFFFLFAAVGLTVFEKVHRVISSLVMTIFWPTYLLAMIPELLNVLYYFNQLDLLEIISVLASFGITIFLIVVNCFSDITGIELENCHKVPPKDLSSFVSGLVFGWFEPIVVNGYRNILRQKDLPAAPDYLDVPENVDNFIQHWNNHIDKYQVDFTNKKKILRRKLDILVPMVKSFGWRFLTANMCAFIGFSWQYSNPMVRTRVLLLCSMIF